MRKIILSILLLIILCSSVTSCGNQNEKEVSGVQDVKNMVIKDLKEYHVEKIISENQGFKQIGGIAALNDKLLISDSKNNRMVLLDKSGNIEKVIGKTGNDLGEFIEPRGIAIDKNGYVYVVDAGNKRIQILNSKYEFVNEIKSEYFKTQRYYSDGLKDIAVDTNGNIYVTMSTIESRYAHIYMIDSKRNVKKIGQNLTGVITSYAEHAYFASTYELFEKNGEIGGRSGKHYFIELNNGNIENEYLLPNAYTPVGIFVDANNFYMISGSKGTIDRFDKKANYLGSLFCQKVDFNHEPYISIMTLDLQGNIYACDKTKGIIYKLVKK